MAVRWLIVAGIGLVLLAACGTHEPEEAVSEATRTLIPPTTTPDPALLDTTPTPTDLPAASALVAAPTESGEALAPAAALSMIDQTMRDLMSQPGIDPVDIRLLGVDEFTWRDESWGCSARAGDGHLASAFTPGYRIVFSTQQRVYVYHTDRREAFFICEDHAWLALEGDPIPLDPIELSMVESSARDAAKHVEAPESAVQLVSLLAVEWPDSSVGCPKPGADYAEVPTPGYRMVFRAEEETLIYHTSIRHFVRCAPDEEILPDLLRQALPTSAPGETG